VSAWASWVFFVLALASWIGVPTYAALARGRFYAIFAAVILSFAIPPAWILHARIGALTGEPIRPWIDLLFAWSMGAAGIQLAHLVRARLRSRLFRLLVSIPGQTFLAAGMLAGPWLLLMLPIRLLLGAFDLETTLAALSVVEALPLLVALLSIARRPCASSSDPIDRRACSGCRSSDGAEPAPRPSPIARCASSRSAIPTSVPGRA
jgi:hypothetical protein